MIDDGKANYERLAPKKESNSLRWIVFGMLLILGAILLSSIFLYSLLEVLIPFSLLTLPMVVFLLFFAYRWASERSVSTYDRNQNHRILGSMRKHALRAEKTGGLEMYRCPDCQMSFELVNAPPIEEDIVFCPHCGIRLLVG